MGGSGMCTGGRVRHHLQHNLGREDASIVFVGYAAIGTLARRIIDGEKQVSIFGKNVPVRARIYTINPHFSRCLIECWGGLTSTVPQPTAVIWAWLLARCGGSVRLVQGHVV